MPELRTSGHLVDVVAAFAVADGAIAGGVVQGEAGTVLGEDGGLQGPVAGLVEGDDLLADEGFADTPAAVAVGDVDRGFGDAGVALARRTSGWRRPSRRRCR